ncbi:GTPase HflX [Alphaproteobacteria bacterium]|nr:GTPase HflX [Alphaproteobacteria bacterium]
MITPRCVIEDACYRQLPVRSALGTPIAFVIHPELRHAPSSRPADLMLEEACLLANAIGLEVVHSEVIALAKLRAGSYFGKGVTERLGDLTEDFTHDIDAPVVIINTSLSPVQQRNLETQIKVKVIDRTQLILEIFGARAQTHAGRLQVELAALSFQRTRLVRSWTHLERQRGGSGFLGGPGERQIELDRRMLMDRVTRIKTELKEVTRTRTLQRSNRLRSETPTVALIGYTNAGKSTLFNRLTGADVLSKDMLFATLDPTMRELDFVSGRKAVLADTVGFISQLPTELIEAFKSTLEEVVHADVLLHVHDASSPLVAEEAADVVKVLVDLGMNAETQVAHVLHVLNKADLLAAGDEQVTSLQNMFSDGVFVSAKTGGGVDDLLAYLDRHLGKSAILTTINITPTDGAARAWLHQNAMVKSSHFDDQGHEQILVSIDPADHARLCARWPDLGVLRAEA